MLKDIDVVMPIYTLIEYSSNDAETTSSWFYSKYEAFSSNIILKTLIILNLSSIRLN